MAFVNPLADKVVIVTGAGSGIGRSIAFILALHKSKLILSGKDEQALQETATICKDANDILVVAGDLTVESDVEKLMEKTIDHYKQLDMLLNCSWTVQPGSIENTSLEQFDMIMNTNMRSVYHLTMLAVPHLISAKGSIVNVSSVAGIKAFPSILSYCLSKAAMDQFTKCLALELAPKNVRVNSINPEDIFIKHLPKSGDKDEKKYAELVEQCKASSEQHILDNQDKVAVAISFLASTHAAFSTGAILPAEGGH